jgi:subtilisin family serine protease
MTGDPIVYFRRNALVFLVTHKGSALDPTQREALARWTIKTAEPILPAAAELIKFESVGHDFAFPAEGYGHQQVESTGQPQHSGLRSELEEVAHELLERGRDLADEIAEHLRPGDAEDEEDEGPKTADKGPVRSDAPAGQAGSAGGDPQSRVEGLPNRPQVDAPPSFTVLFPTFTNVSFAELVRLAKRLDDERATFKEGIELVQVSLDWYCSGGQPGMGSGGPGGKPTVITGSRSTRHPFKLPDLLEDRLRGINRGAGIEVAILDTSPSDDDLDKAHGNLGAPGGHPVIGTLLGPAGRMDCEHHDLSRLGTIHIEGHDYVMSDHGLFVAGIIHTIAPHAKLHLIEVLNKMGVGDTDSIAAGIESAAKMIASKAQNRPAPKWVVNASLMTAAPSDDFHLVQMMDRLGHQPPGMSADDTTEQAKLLDYLKVELADSGSGMQIWLVTRQSDAVVYMCNYLYVNGKTRVIAAAGNDRKGLSELQPLTRYPAKAKSVLGIGALKRDDSAASYSNVDDVLPDDGIVTFGGEPGAGVMPSASGLAAAPQSEVLGVYIGSDPNHNPSTDGWAVWSGTSFATPIVSGVTVALLSLPGRFTSAQAAIDLLTSLTVPRNDGNFLDVKQL